MENEREDDEMRWHTLKREYVIKRPWLTARKDMVQLTNGRIYDEYYCLEYPAWVNIIAETEDGHLLFEKQYRHGADIISTEIPAGCVEKDETPLLAAKRELLEETGYAGGEWRQMLVSYPNPGTQNNKAYTFVAKGVKQITGQHLDATEDLKFFLITKEEALQLLKDNKIAQCIMIGALWQYFYEEGLLK